MARRAQPLSQTQIPVSDYGWAIKDDADREKAYAEMFGEEALEKQKRLAEERKACACDSEKPNRVGKQFHRPGCPMVNPRAYV